MCETPIEGAPLTLPCDHVVCRMCYQTMVATNMTKDLVCFECQCPIPEDFNADISYGK